MPVTYSYVYSTVYTQTLYIQTLIKSLRCKIPKEERDRDRGSLCATIGGIKSKPKAKRYRSFPLKRRQPKTSTHIYRSPHAHACKYAIRWRVDYIPDKTFSSSILVTCILATLYLVKGIDIAYTKVYT